MPRLTTLRFGALVALSASALLLTARSTVRVQAAPSSLRDLTIDATSSIKAVHIQELRTAAVALQ